jgi:hypothetical protein
MHRDHVAFAFWRIENGLDLSGQLLQRHRFLLIVVMPVIDPLNPRDLVTEGALSMFAEHLIGAELAHCPFEAANYLHCNRLEISCSLVNGQRLSADAHGGGPTTKPTSKTQTQKPENRPSKWPAVSRQVVAATTSSAAGKIRDGKEREAPKKA